jgi:SAM-dependent methyltransferase
VHCADDIPWDEVAAYYDAYVRSEDDLGFWREAAAAAEGPVLEVMCGTGRITLPLLEAGFTVTGVDRSAELTAVLRDKIAARGLGERATIVDADARDFALDRRFALVFVGFQSLCEILDPAAREAVVGRLAEHLVDGGRLILTFHNPSVRAAAIDPGWRVYGAFDLRPGIRLEVAASLEARGGIVRGAQRYRELEEGGHCVHELRIPIAFALIERPEIDALAAAAGLEVTALYGDYDGGAFDPEASPYMIAALSRP